MPILTFAVRSSSVQSVLGFTMKYDFLFPPPTGAGGYSIHFLSR